MAVVFSPLVVEVAVVQTLAGRPCVNVLHQRAVDETWPKTPAEMAQDVADNWQDHILEVQTNAITVLNFEWRSLDASDNSVGTIAPNATKGVIGRGPGASFPPNVAMLIKKQTQDRPRGKRDGRIFLGGISEGDVGNDGTINAGALALWEADVADFYDGISDTGTLTNNGHYPVVLETTEASRAPGTAQVTVQSRRVTELVIDPKVSTQRDRLR